MTDKLKPMDVYAWNMAVPVAVGIYCRQHKFSTEAVALARAIRAKGEADILLSQAQDRCDARGEEMRQAIVLVQQTMEKADAK